MMDTALKRLMDNCNKAWKPLALILDDESMGYDHCVNLMLTLNARYLNGISKLPVEFNEFKKIIKEEYIKLLEDKLPNV